MTEEVKGYISLRVSDASSNSIKKFFSDRGLVCNIVDLHSTLIYDEEINFNPVNDDYIKRLSKGNPIYGKVKGGEVLGDREKGFRSPVLLIDSPTATEIHNHLIECGYHHSFDEYLAHISINYNLPEEEMDKYLAAINELVGMVIEYDAIEVEIIRPREEILAEKTIK